MFHGVYIRLQKHRRLLSRASLVADLKEKNLGGFKDLLFLPLPGETIQFDEHFSNGWLKHRLEIHSSRDW